jgi:hypothetical protein
VRHGTKAIESLLMPICRIPLRILATAFLLVIAHVDPSFAHPPYFTQVEKIVLSDGQIGEMRLLHGDGILMPDPVRLIVLDSAGRLIGYSREDFGPHSIICSAVKRCAGYNHGEGLILEFNATEPFAGPVVADGLSADLWNKPRNVSVNIRTRPPAISEYVAANFQLAKFYYFLVVPIAVVGALMGLLGWLLWGIGTGGDVGIITKFMLWIVMLGAEFFLLAISIFHVIFSGRVSGIVWFMSLCFGAFSVFAIRQIVRCLKRSRRQSAQA